MCGAQARLGVKTQEEFHARFKTDPGVQQELQKTFIDANTNIRKAKFAMPKYKKLADDNVLQQVLRPPRPPSGTGDAPGTAARPPVRALIHTAVCGCLWRTRCAGCAGVPGRRGFRIGADEHDAEAAAEDR